MNAAGDNEGGNARNPNRKAVFFGIAIVLIVVTGVAAFFVAKPAYRWIRAKRAAAIAQEARAHIEAESWREAANSLREANKLDSKEPEVLRALAEFYSFADLRRQKQMLYRLYEAGDHNAQDLRNLIGLELRFRNPSKAKQLTSDLLENFDQDTESLRVAVQVAKVRKDLVQTETYLRKLLVAAPEEIEARLELGTVLLESMFAEKVSSGWDEIYSLAQQTDETGLEALRLIVRRRPFFPGRITEIEELTKKHPGATETDHLSALGWRYQATASASERSAILEKSIAEVAERSPLENRSFYFWLNMIEEHDHVLELMSKEEAYSAPGLLTVYITALLQAERRDDIISIIEAGAELDSSSEVAFIKAQCALYLELSTSIVRDFLQESYELALLDKRTAMLIHIANLADKQGLRDLAVTAFEAMSRIPETSLRGLEQLLKHKRREGDLSAMRSILREVREKVPDDLSVLKMAVYHDLLQGVNMEASFKAITDLLERVPNDGECTLILSFAHFRLGNLEASVKVAGACQVSELSPSYRAVYATIIGTAGDSLAAVVIAEKLPRSLLLKEELDLVKKWLPAG